MAACMLTSGIDAIGGCGSGAAVSTGGGVGACGAVAADASGKFMEEAGVVMLAPGTAT